jgi:hypothetical protein
MQKYLSETKALVKAGKQEEALKRFIWFHEHALEHQPSMYGVRLSFALSSWKELGDAYPPALKAMEKLRDENASLLREGKGDPNLFHDLVALNQTLKADKASVELFEHIHQTDASKAKTYWIIVKDVVLGQKRYDLANLYIQNLEAEYDRVKAAYDRNLASYNDPRFGGDRFKSYNEGRFVKEVRALIELSLALDNRNAAVSIRDNAITVLDDQRLKVEIPAGAMPK